MITVPVMQTESPSRDSSFLIGIISVYIILWVYMRVISCNYFSPSFSAAAISSTSAIVLVLLCIMGTVLLAVWRVGKTLGQPQINDTCMCFKHMHMSACTCSENRF